MNETRLREALTELQTSWQKIISESFCIFFGFCNLLISIVESSRVGVVKAVVDRAATLHCAEAEVVEVRFEVVTAFTELKLSRQFAQRLSSRATRIVLHSFHALCA